MNNNQEQLWGNVINALENFDCGENYVEIVPSDDRRPWYERIRDGKILGN